MAVHTIYLGSGKQNNTSFVVVVPREDLEYVTVSFIVFLF